MRRVLLLALLCAGCGDTTIVDPMERQPKFRAFAANPLYEDGRAMRNPPEGTVPRERPTMLPEITTGRDRNGQIVSKIPVAITWEAMLRGRTLFYTAADEAGFRAALASFDQAIGLVPKRILTRARPAP